MASEDVIHSFFVPAFRFKRDVVPGRFATAWFEATKPGKYHLFCAEFCGTRHSGMIGWVYVMTPPDYQAWLSGGVAGESLAAAGAKRFVEHACNTCHGDQPGARGPSLNGIFGKPVRLQGGGTVMVDEAYIRESIVNPHGEAGRGLSSDHADVPGPHQRGGAPPADRLHQVPVSGRGPGGRHADARGRRRGKETREAMSATAPDETPRVAERPNYLNTGYGVKSWLLTIDHKRIAILYLIGVTFFFAVGGLYAAAIRLELLTPAGDVFQAETYNKLFTTHGVMMVFFFMIPGIPGVLGNFLIPLMIGAKDVAFPRLNLLSWYLYIIGGLIALWATVHGGVDTGWTFYTPYSTVYSNGWVVVTGVGIFIAGFSSILTGLNFLVTIHTMRAPGMGWIRMPLFCWSMYATAIIQILGTPVIAITLLLLVAERALPPRHLRPGAGRRPGALPAPLLVLLAPRRLHHDPAGHGGHQRARHGLLAQADLRLQVHRGVFGRDRHALVPGLGTPHVRLGPVGLRRARLLDPLVHGRRAVGDQGLQLDGHALQGIGVATRRRCSTPWASSASSRSAG